MYPRKKILTPNICYFSQLSKNVLLLPINLHSLIIINLFSKLLECGKCSGCTIYKKAITQLSNHCPELDT